MRRLLLAAFVLAAGTTLWITNHPTTSGSSGEVSSPSAGSDLIPASAAPAALDAAAAPTAAALGGAAEAAPPTALGAKRGSKDQPIDLGVPEGPFDPVLAVAADGPFRMPPPVNKVVNNRAGESTGITQSEVSIAVNGDKIVIGWNDGYGFVDGSGLTGVSYSNDRGETWTDQDDLPGTTSVRVFGDPTLAALPGDRWLGVSLDRGNSSGIAINIGNFSGSAPVWQNAFAYNDTNWSLDKEYIEYDEATGRLYMSYVGFPQGTTRGRLTYSEDGGQTWSAPLTVNEGSSTNGYYPAVAPDGGIYVSWVQPLFSGNADMYCRYSADGGLSWEADRTLIKRNGPNAGQAPQCFNRGSNITWPSLAVDRSDGPFRGRVYAVYSDGGAGTYNSFVRYSDDHGQTWSDEVRLNDNTNTSEQFWPQATTGPDGRVSVGWYDRRNASGNNSLCDFYVTQSVDGGVNWGPNRRMSDMSVAWCNVPSNIAPNFGDYIECISDDRSVFGVWSDARMGDPDVVFSRIDDYQTLATNGNFGGASAFSANAVAYLIPNEAELEVSPSPIQSPGEVAFVSTVFGLLATPPETQGIYTIGGKAISGSLQLTSSLGTMTGDFSLASTGDNDIAFDFDVASNVQNTGLNRNYTMQLYLIDNGPGQVVVTGNVTFTRFGSPPAEFAVSGTVDLDGAPGANLGNAHHLTQEASFSNGLNLIVHTRTMVEDGVVVSVPDVALGTNPPPLALVRQSPNPWAPGASIKFQLTHDASDLNVRVYTPEGRMVREITSGAYRQGEYEIPFDGKDSQGRELPNGGYFLKLQANNVNAAAKLFVVR